MTKPRVLIALATGILGGPGKGLVQFLRHGGLEGCSPVVIDYHRGFEKGETDFVKAVKTTGATMATLHQRSTLDRSLVRQAMDLVRRHGISILQSHGYKSHALCWLLRRKTGLPWIAFVHGWTRENLRMRLYTALEQALLLAADEVVAVSESLRGRLLFPVRRRCRVIPNALAAEEMADGASRSAMRERLGYGGDALVVGIVGRLSPEKGHSVFLRALAAARRRNPLLRGLVVGDGQEMNALAAEAELLGLDGACLFTGHTASPASCYRAMDIQVMPSFTEGMPNAALEGMFMELPLIAARVGGIPEVVAEGETGLLIPPGQPEALADAMLFLASSPERRKAMGRAGSERIRAFFSPQARTGRILSMYRDVLAHNQNQEQPR